MIRRCTHADIAAVEVVINEAARSYRGVIPPDCWHEPYMTRIDLIDEIAAGVNFWCWDESGVPIGIMGLQKVHDVNLIRHAYVTPAHQSQGIGGALVRTFEHQAKGPLLVGTWAAAKRAIRFYERHGFHMVSAEETDRLLRAYWSIPLRQREASVVLTNIRSSGIQSGSC